MRNVMAVVDATEKFMASCNHDPNRARRILDGIEAVGEARLSRALNAIEEYDELNEQMETYIQKEFSNVVPN